MYQRLILPLAATLLFGPATAFAAVDFSARAVDLTIVGSRPDFADASLAGIATTTVAPGSSGSRSLDFYTAPNIASSTTSTTGDVALTGFNLGPDGHIQATVDATGGGSFAFHNSYPPEADPFAASYLYRYLNGNDALVPFTNFGLPALEIFLPIGGAGLVDQDGVFSISVSLAGDYSTTAGLDSSSGQHFLAYLDAPWEITQDFVYGNGVTTFTAVNNHYQYGATPDEDQNPYLDVYFFGAAAVPEPASWAMLFVGFAATGAMLRRRPALAQA